MQALQRAMALHLVATLQRCQASARCVDAVTAFPLVPLRRTRIDVEQIAQIAACRRLSCRDAELTMQALQRASALHLVASLQRCQASARCVDAVTAFSA